MEFCQCESTANHKDGLCEECKRAVEGENPGRVVTHAHRNLQERVLVNAGVSDGTPKEDKVLL